MTKRFLIFALLLLVSSAAFAQNSDLSAVILADPTGDASRTFSWSIDVINNGPGDARNVTVTGSTDPTFTTRCSPQIIDIIYGDSHTVVQCTTQGFSTTGDVVLHAHSATSNDSNPGNNDSTRTVHSIAGGADIGLSVVPPRVDTSLPFNIVAGIYNNGRITATGVTATLSLPSLVRVVKLPDGCQQAGQTITCSVDDIAAHSGSPALTFTLAADDALNGETIPIPTAVHTTAP